MAGSLGSAGTSEIADVDVVVVGAGLAGLTAAWDVVEHGLSAVVLEATDRVGGRARSVRLGAETADLGAEWVGGAHHQVLALARRFGVRTEPARNLGVTTLWRLPSGEHVGRLPPPGTRRDLVRMLVAAARQSRGLNPCHPWSGPRADELDAISTGEWLRRLGTGTDTRYLLDSMIGSLASARLDSFSALHFLWWARLAGGPLRSLRTTFQYRFSDGAQELPRRIAARLPDLRLDAPVRAIDHDAGGATVHAGGLSVRARCVVVAVPTSGAAATIRFSPPIPQLAEESRLSVGPGTKIAALLPSSAPASVRAVIGGQVLAGAWRRGRRVTGFATLDADPSPEAMAGDLAGAFGVKASALSHVQVYPWAEHPFIPGCDLALRPGEVTGIAPRLRLVTETLVFAGAERSAWPNNLEGAVQSGQAAAERVRGEFARAAS